MTKREREERENRIAREEQAAYEKAFPLKENKALEYIKNAINSFDKGKKESQWLKGE